MHDGEQRVEASGSTRRGLGWTAAPVLVFALVSAGCDPEQQPEARAGSRPNIVLIMLDDFGYECVTANGGRSYETPAIDRLAEGGVRFEHCYAQPLCTPSRVKLMTGRSNIRNYVEFGHLDTAERTFANLLQEAGYATCVAGKWQLGGDAGTIEGFGFDEHCVWNMSAPVVTEASPRLKRPAGARNRYGNPSLYRNGEWLEPGEGAYGPDVCSDFVESFMESHKEQPFLVYWPMILTHCPFEPPPGTPDWPEASGGSRNYKGQAQYFGAMVAHADKLVGRITQKLDELGLRQSTLVLLTGDNGTDSPIVSLFDARELEAGKGRTTDAGTRVPLIASWPGKAAVGSVNAGLVDFSDFLPTLCQCAGIELPAEPTLDGVSFLPQVLGQSASTREAVYCYYNPRPRKGVPGVRFARDRRWKLYGDGRLFDVPGDVLEERPLPLDGPDPEAAAARTRLQAVIDSKPAQPQRIAAD